MKNNKTKILIGLFLMVGVFIYSQQKTKVSELTAGLESGTAYFDGETAKPDEGDLGTLSGNTRSLASIERNLVSKKYTEILKDSKFKRYKNISFKVIRTTEEKEEYRRILRDEFLLNSAVDLITSDAKSFNHDLEVAHLDISQFLLEALKLNGDDQVVVDAIKKVLSVNLSEQQGLMNEKAYKLLKEDKAEIMYRAIATNQQIAKWYSPDSNDVVSQKIYENVNNRYKSNVAESKRMISQR